MKNDYDLDADPSETTPNSGTATSPVESAEALETEELSDDEIASIAGGAGAVSEPPPMGLSPSSA